MTKIHYNHTKFKHTLEESVTAMINITNIQHPNKTFVLPMFVLFSLIFYHNYNQTLFLSTRDL